MSKSIIRDAIKAQGDNAPEHFGFKKSTLERYMRKGMYPEKLIQQINAEREAVSLPNSFSEFPTSETPSTPPIETPIVPEARPLKKKREQVFESAAEVEVIERVSRIENYIQGTVDFYIKHFMDRLATTDQNIQRLIVEHNRHLGMPSLSRPDQGVPVDQTFTTSPSGHPLDTGVAPSKAQVDAQANMTTLEGVPIPHARPAGPAVPLTNQPAFGFGWNKARPR